MIACALSAVAASRPQRADASLPVVMPGSPTIPDSDAIADILNTPVPDSTLAVPLLQRTLISDVDSDSLAAAVMPAGIEIGRAHV